MDWNDAIPVVIILLGIMMFAFVMVIGLTNVGKQQSNHLAFQHWQEVCWNKDMQLTCHNPNENNVVCKCTEITHWQEKTP